MAPVMLFNDVLEAVDRLSAEEQEELVSIVRRRLVEQARKRALSEIREARAEFEAGKCRPVTTEELMREILS